MIKLNLFISKKKTKSEELIIGLVINYFVNSSPVDCRIFRQLTGKNLSNVFPEYDQESSEDANPVL